MLFLYDTVQKKKLPFEPIKPKEATLYVCGPTVYDDAHLGHARSALSFDLLRRTLKAYGYKVTMGKNFTDIDDKIIKKIEQTNQTLEEITTFYIDRYLSEMESLGIERADIEPKATESLDAITSMIKTLIHNGFAYLTSSGDVYFDTAKDTRYGTLSNQVNEQETQSRVIHTDEKHNPKDFALWKSCKKEEDICFDTPFSKGRPGWHIECSAMIQKHFQNDGEFSIDIHGGGADLLFPHHENEATQSRCATGRELAKYWIHNGFVQIDGEKMSKSLGNSFFLKDALAVYDGEILRYYLGSVHYRNNFNFNEEDLLNAKKRLDKLYRLKKRIVPSSGSAPQKEFKKSLFEAMGDDLNISLALSVIDEMIATANEKLDANPKDKALKKELIANIQLIATLLGFGTKEPFAYFKIGVDETLKTTIETLVTERTEAKKSKDFLRSDAIRDQLSALGVALMDTADGTVWEKV